MKVAGIIFTVLGVINFLVALIATGNGHGNDVGGKFSGGILFLILGIFLITQANKKKRKQEEKEKWERGDN